MRFGTTDSSVYAGSVLDRSAALPVEAKAITGYGAAIAALTVFVCRVLIASAIVPPWQGPDEPTHFALAKQLAGGEFSQAAVSEIERETLKSMARHGWWRFYQEPTPDPLPYAFSQVPDHLSAGTLDQPAYYLLASGVLRAARDSDIDGQYFALRLVSIVLAVLTLVFGWLGTRALFGNLTAAGALALVSLHPQFLLSAISVNPDVLIDLCGAFVWWQIARLCNLTGMARASTLVLVVAASLVAVLSKRNGIPLPLVSAAAATVALRRSDRRMPPAAVAAATLFTLGFAALVVVAGHYSDFIGRLVNFWGSAVVSRRSISGVTASALLQFAGAANDTAWLYAGWLRFPPPQLWSWTARTLTFTGLAASVWLAVRSGSSNRAFLIAWTFVAIHAGTLLGVAFVAVSVPQGRYIFAVLFPIAALLWRGLMCCFRPVLKAQAPVAIVGIVAVLDACGFLFVLFPAYVYNGAGPSF